MCLESGPLGTETKGDVSENRKKKGRDGMTFGILDGETSSMRQKRNQNRNELVICEVVIGP